MLHEFRELLPIHLTHFKKLYPELNIIPKQHFMVHIPNMVRQNGPLYLNSCLKYELRNRSIKRPAQAISCFQNITKTLTERNQLTSLQQLSFGDLLRDKYVTTHKVRRVLVSDLPGWDIIAHQFSIDKDDFIQTCNRIQFCGSSYGVDDIVVISLDSECKMPQFGRVVRVIWRDEQAFLILKKVITLQYVRHLHSYEIKVSDSCEITLKHINDLYDFHPLSARYYPEFNGTFVRLHYALV